MLNRRSPPGKPAAKLRYAGFTFPAPLDALWSYRRRPASDLNLVKAARAAIVWRSNTGTKAAIQAGRYLGWFLRFPKELVRRIAAHGSDTKKRLGRSYSGQVADMLSLATSNGLMPRDYYEGELARHQGGRETFDYVPFHLYATVATHLALERSAAGVALTRDKKAFEHHCRDLGLPVVRTVAIADPDAVRVPTDGTPVDALPFRDLLIKPVDGSQGRNIERLRYIGHGNFADATSKPLCSDDLMLRLSRLSRSAGSAMLVQECLENNADLIPISGSALSTTRLVTLMNERDEPEIVEAYYRTSVVPTATVDNFHGGGVLFPVDIATGKLRAGCGEVFNAVSPILEHPETGNTVAGRMLPGWDEMAALSRRAHRLFPELAISGWDIAYSPDGPVIVEANVPPGMTIQRQAVSRPFSDTRFFALLAFHASCWLEAVEPAGSRWRAKRPVPSSDAIRTIEAMKRRMRQKESAGGDGR